MKGLLWRGLVVVVALFVALPVAMQPAQAQDNTNNRYSELFVDVLKSMLDKGSSGYTPQEIAQLILEITGAIDGVKVDLLARLNSELLNEMKGNVESATTGLGLLSRPALAGPYVNSLRNSAYHAKNHIDTVSADADVDAVGRSMMTLFTTLEVAYTAIEAPELMEGELPSYRQGLEHLIESMNPHCELWSVPNADFHTYECTFNGKEVTGVYQTGWVRIDGGPQVPGSLGSLKAEVGELVMSESARPLAEAANEVLKQRGVGLP